MGPGSVGVLQQIITELCDATGVPISHDRFEAFLESVRSNVLVEID